MSATVAFREARPTDLGAIVAFAAALPEPCPRWRDDIAAEMEDPAVRLAVGEFAGEIVGVGRLGTVGMREGWLGRQLWHPGFRQLNLAYALTDFQTELARRLELRVVRVGWQGPNTGMHRAAAKLGYHRVAAFSAYSSESLGSGAPVLSLLTERDYSAIQNRLGHSSIYRAGAGLFALNGQWMELTGRHVRASLAEGQGVGLRDPSGRLEAFALASSPPMASRAAAPVCLGYVDGEWQALERLALGLRGLAQASGASRTVVQLVDDPTVRGIFQAAGFQDESEGRDLWLFERFLEGGAGL